MTATPRHIAIIMDGNGRWARSKGMPRPAGHRASVKVVKHVVEECAARKVGYLTLFAFSSENWQRPPDEVGVLMSLFLDALDREVAQLHSNHVRLRFIGDRKSLGRELNERMNASEALTRIVGSYQTKYGSVAGSAGTPAGASIPKPVPSRGSRIAAAAQPDGSTGRPAGPP